jgi:RND superfamily putative drug exporter
VFLTFALPEPLPPKEMGIIPASRCCSARLLVPVDARADPVRPRLVLPRWLDRLLPDVRFGH